MEYRNCLKNVRAVSDCRVKIFRSAYECISNGTNGNEIYFVVGQDWKSAIFSGSDLCLPKAMKPAARIAKPAKKYKLRLKW